MRRRGQLVLLAAVALAIALVPMALAHLQLGYTQDMESVTVDSPPLSETDRVLHRAVDDATATIPAQYDWANRTDAVAAVRSRLRPTRTTANRSRLADGTVTRISYNQTRASTWARNNCPRGNNRQFGTCLADRGVVVQERLGKTHVLAIAFEIESTTRRGVWHTVSVVRTGTRSGSS